jgi:hypothetical protein
MVLIVLMVLVLVLVVWMVGMVLVMELGRDGGLGVVVVV